MITTMIINRNYLSPFDILRNNEAETLPDVSQTGPHFKFLKEIN